MEVRWYRSDRDLAQMLALVTASTLRDGLSYGHLHVGDVVWGLFQNSTIDPTNRVVLFAGAEGDLQGFIWLRPPQGFDVHADTTRPDAAATLNAMIDWAERHIDSTATATGTDPYTMEVASTNGALRDVAAGHGYRPTGEAPYQLNHQPISDRLPAPALPVRAEVRPVRLDDPAAIEARVALHREVWGSTKFSASGYATLREKPVYRPDLDLVAVTPEGELAAYCIVWWDPLSRTGLFEPVGTAVAHRQRGYGRALLRDALHRLRALGATDALVVSSTAPDGEPARRLYRSLGFEVVSRFEQWERVPGDRS